MSKTTTSKDPPETLQHDSVEARVVRQKVWRACNVENQHFMAAIVGREGSGKSLTALKIAHAADPSFNADRVMFEPQAFLERLRGWKEKNETTDKVVVADEAGVGLGVRTWYNKDQVLFNQVLQVIRDENMGIIFTLPRLTELDSQTRGRLHALLEMTKLDSGNWAELKWKNWQPTRDDRNEVYRKYPKIRVDGHARKVTRLRFGPPPEDLVNEYEVKKDAFQDELYQDAIDEMDDDADDDGMPPSDIADEIVENGVDEYVSVHGGNKTEYLDSELIEMDYELSARDAKKVKKLLERDDRIDV